MASVIDNELFRRQEDDPSVPRLYLFAEGYAWWDAPRYAAWRHSLYLVY